MKKIGQNTRRMDSEFQIKHSVSFLSIPVLARGIIIKLF